MRFAWIALLLSIALVVLPSGRAASGSSLSLLGYATFGGGEYCALRDADTGRSAWVPIGGRFEHTLLKAFDHAADTLTVQDETSGEVSVLRLPKGSVKSVAGIEPLSRPEAIKAVKRLLSAVLSTKPRPVKIEELPPDVQRKIKAQIAAQAVTLPPVPRTETAEQRQKALTQALETSGKIVVGTGMKDGLYHVDTVTPLRLSDLPTYISANLSQSDLDDLRDLQLQAFSANAKKAGDGGSVAH